MTKIDMVETVSEDAVPTKQEGEETPQEEKETPTETPTVEKPADKLEGDQPKPGEELEGEIPEETPEVSDDAEDREIVGLKAQRDKLEKEVKSNIVNLRAQRREQRKQDIPKPVNDIDPEVSKQMEQMGYATKEEIVSELNRNNSLKGMKDADNEFYDKNPEYVFSQQLRQAHDNIMDSLKEAQTAEDYKEQLELAHSIVKDKNPTLFPSSSDSTLAAKKQALILAGKGTGGKAGSPQKESLMSPEEEAHFRRAGYSDEEIKRMKLIKQNK